MNWSLYLNAYLLIGVCVLAALAYRDEAEARVAFVLMLFWPILIIIVPWVLLEERSPFRVEFGMRRDLSCFGMRKPDGTWGRAVRLFWFEIRVWKKRAA